MDHFKYLIENKSFLKLLQQTTNENLVPYSDPGAGE
jgi:hypothetical protein